MKKPKPKYKGQVIAGFMPPFIRELRDAIREDRKGQTRRVMKNQPFSGATIKPYMTGTKWPLAIYSRRGDGCWESGPPLKCPYGQPGEIRALREPLVKGEFQTNGVLELHDENYTDSATFYADDGQPVGNPPTPWRWKVKTLSQLYMPYEAVRTFTRYTDIRFEPVQEISGEDAQAEGAEMAPQAIKYKSDAVDRMRYVMGFASLWDSINAKRGYSWASNPWVWVVDFERLD